MCVFRKNSVYLCASLRKHLLYLVVVGPLKINLSVNLYKTSLDYKKKNKKTMPVKTRSMVRKRPPPQKKLKRCMPNVRDVAKIRSILGEALFHNQHFLKKRTPDSEIGDWDEGELQNFAIDLDKVNQLYNVDYKTSYWGEMYVMTGQMEYKGKPLHVNLFAVNDPGKKKKKGFDESTWGEIFVTRSLKKLIDYLVTNTIRMKHGENPKDCFLN